MVQWIGPDSLRRYAMLCISIRPGEYFTVGGSTVIQFDRLSGDRAYLMIQAPRETAIVRGEVLERNGGQRPACITDTAPAMSGSSRGTTPKSRRWRSCGRCWSRWAAPRKHGP